MSNKGAPDEPVGLYGIGNFPLFLFNNGDNYRAYETLGCHPYTHDGKAGMRFAVWAPGARSVSLVSDLNDWDAAACPMTLIGETGVWAAFVPGMPPGTRYKYVITPAKGAPFFKADPFAFLSELRPGTASVACAPDQYQWTDAKYIAARDKTAPYSKPMNIYEVHAGSWKRNEDGSFYTYIQLAETLIPYVCEMGYTHIELMPIMEYPFDGSWGYQVTGYFAATARYGAPEDLMYFVDMCHKNGIGVIMDWVPAHFPTDAYGLAKFDGAALYEYADTRIGRHEEWGTLVFDYKRAEVVSFLISSAFFWLEVYHMDGLRVDAVSSMLYRSYGREKGEWVPNEYGGDGSLEAVAFLKKLNQTIFARFPNALMVAEEATSWPKITHPVDKGGLGFNYKWNMGWMNDILKYIGMDPYFRQFNHNLLTFLMFYAFSENYILPLSHDEVVHGKKSLLDKIQGPYDDKFATLRALYAYTMALPGKKLLFMGGEFGQFIEWRFAADLDWLLLAYESHRRLQGYVKTLNHFYLKSPPFWEIEDGWAGFGWLNEHDGRRNVISFMRSGKKKTDKVYVVSNFSPVAYPNYMMFLPGPGEYEAALNSNAQEFGGKSGKIPARKAFKLNEPYNGYTYAIEFDLPPLCTVYWKKKER